MPWNEKSECMPVAQIQAFQVEKLRETLEWVTKRVPFYKKKYKEAGVKAADIKSIEDVAKLPFTVKNDLRDNYPFGLCAVPLKDVVRVHASSGTTGKPITGPYTTDDLAQWGECLARNFHAAGVRSEHIVQNAYGYGLFTGGLGFHQGATVMGCTVVHQFRAYRTPDYDLERFRHQRPVQHPFLCPDHCRTGRGAQGGSKEPAPFHRHFRRRTLDHRHA